MISYQNHQGLNRLILRPLWLMTSAAADVISVPSVPYGIMEHMLNIGPGYGLLPGGANLFPEPLLAYHQLDP